MDSLNVLAKRGGGRCAITVGGLSHFEKSRRSFNYCVKSGFAINWGKLKREGEKKRRITSEIFVPGRSGGAQPIFVNTCEREKRTPPPTLPGKDIPREYPRKGGGAVEKEKRERPPCSVDGERKSKSV